MSLRYVMRHMTAFATDYSFKCFFFDMGILNHLSRGRLTKQGRGERDALVNDSIVGNSIVSYFLVSGL